MCGLHRRSTVSKFHDFTITWILREINFVDSRNAKSTILKAHLEALNSDSHEFLHFLKAESYQVNKMSEPQIGKNGKSRTSSFSKVDFT